MHRRPVFKQITWHVTVKYLLCTVLRVSVLYENRSFVETFSPVYIGFILIDFSLRSVVISRCIVSTKLFCRQQHKNICNGHFLYWTEGLFSTLCSVGFDVAYVCSVWSLFQISKADTYPPWPVYTLHPPTSTLPYTAHLHPPLHLPPPPSPTHPTSTLPSILDSVMILSSRWALLVPH